MLDFSSLNNGVNSLDEITRKELFRFAAEHYLIEEVTPWFNYHRNRNQIPHTYEEKTAVEVFTCIKPFLFDAQALLTSLNNKND